MNAEQQPSAASAAGSNPDSTDALQKEHPVINHSAPLDRTSKASVADSTISAVRRNLDPELARTFDAKMRSMSARVKGLGNVLAPWTLLDNKEKARQVAQVLEQDRAQMTEMMNSLLEAYKEVSQEAAEARMQLADKSEQERLAKEHEERIEKMNLEVAQLRDFKKTQSSNMRSILQRVDTISSRRSSNQGAQLPDLSNLQEDMSDQQKLQEKVEMLLAEHEKLTLDAEKSAKSKQDMEKKLKEERTKAADDNEVKAREIKLLQSALKKAEEKKEAEIVAAKKDMLEQVEKRKKDMELMQRRLNAAKTENDGYKAREKTIKAQLDEALAAAAKAQEEVKAIKGRLADTRAAKEDVQRELTMAQYEAQIVTEEYRELVQALVQSQGFEALPCAKRFVKHTAPFPRTAFTMKNGKVLYNRAIHPGMDVSKIEPREYKDHKELQELMVEEGLVLDKQCGPETF